MLLLLLRGYRRGEALPAAARRGGAGDANQRIRLLLLWRHLFIPRGPCRPPQPQSH